MEQKRKKSEFRYHDQYLFLIFNIFLLQEVPDTSMQSSTSKEMSADSRVTRKWRYSLYLSCWPVCTFTLRNWILQSLRIWQRRYGTHCYKSSLRKVLQEKEKEILHTARKERARADILWMKEVDWHVVHCGCPLYNWVTWFSFYCRRSPNNWELKGKGSWN